MNNIEKASTYLQGLASGDSALATRCLDPARYIEHNPHSRDGVEGVREYVDQLAAEHPDLKVIRAYQDGPYVVTQADGHVRGDGTFFDVFRIDDGLIVEHWGFSAPAGPPNKSGHTQLDGPTEPEHGQDTEKNKELVREYYQTFHVEGRHDLAPKYFAGDFMIRHEPGVADGITAFLRDLAVVTRDRTIDEIKLLVGQGDLVFIAAKGTHAGDPCVYIDLYRVENDRLVEHWGFPQPVPSPEKRMNANGML